jgi:hypothetical protein
MNVIYIVFSLYIVCTGINIETIAYDMTFPFTIVANQRRTDALMDEILTCE